MKIENLEKVKAIKNELDKLSYFLDVIFTDNEYKEHTSRLGVIKIKTEKSISFLSSRRFGGGTHESELKLPQSLLPKMILLFNNRRDELTLELKELLK